MKQSSHFDAGGNAVMVDVSDKTPTHRTAIAQGHIALTPTVRTAVEGGTAKKGDVLAVARIAGIMATKHTSTLIPLCHPLPITHASVDFAPTETGVTARCTVSTVGITGVEMEALTGVTAALLTIYDMCKGMDKSLVLSDIHLVEKTGGKSGGFRYEQH